MMAAPSRADSFVHSQLIEAARKHDERGFLLLHGTALVLVVVVPLDDRAFEQELGIVDASSSRLAFRTESVGPAVLARAPRAAARGEHDDASVLLSLLRSARGFALPLCKRASSDALYPDRISLGRARNKDIVLRHGSVSKFHAWFETDASEGLCVADAESRNATRLNDQVLVPRQKAPVHAGDRLRFGTVDAVLCEPSTLWSLTHSASGLEAAGR